MVVVEEGGAVAEVVGVIGAVGAVGAVGQAALLLRQEQRHSLPKHVSQIV